MLSPRDSFDMHSPPVQLVGIDYLKERSGAENSATDTQTKVA